MGRLKGSFEEAQALHERALSGRRTLHGEDHPEIFRCKNNLALVLKDRDDKTRFDSQKAEQLYREARAGATSRLGLDHPDTLTYEHNLAVLLGNNSDEAEKLYRHVVEGREKRLGLENPDTLRSLSSLACLLEVKGDMQNAKKMQYMAYKGLQLRLGEDHPHTLTCMNNLATRLAELIFKIRFSRGWPLEFREEPLCRRALRNRECHLGREHRDTLTSVNNLAFLLKSKKMYADAEYYYRRALDGFQSTLGPDHHDPWTGLRASLFESGKAGANDPALVEFLEAISKEQELILSLADRQHTELVATEMLASRERPVEQARSYGSAYELIQEFAARAPDPPYLDEEDRGNEIASACQAAQAAEATKAAEIKKERNEANQQSEKKRGSNKNDAQKLVGEHGMRKKAVISKLKGLLDYVAGALVLVNALVMVCELEMEGSAAGVFIGLSEGPLLNDVEPVFRTIDAVFVYLFLLELLFRIYAERTHWVKDMANWFDAFLVLVSLVESWPRLWLFGSRKPWHPEDMYVLTPLAMANDASQGQGDMVRSLRTLKSLRAIRVLRTFRFFDGLRLFAKACSSLLPSLGWSLVVLGMFICMGALLIGNLLRSFILDDSASLDDRQWIWNRYGTAYRATYTLYETWRVFAMIRTRLSLISAIFLKDTLDAAQNDAENLVLQRLRKKAEYLQKLEDVFAAIDDSGDGMITEEKLAKVFSNPTAVSESAALFHILDNGDGEVTHEEFIDGIMRCKGPARAMDQVAMLADACLKYGPSLFASHWDRKLWVEFASSSLQVSIRSRGLEAARHENVQGHACDANQRLTSRSRQANQMLSGSCSVSKLGGHHPDTLRSVLHFSAVLRARGQFREAEGLCREVHSRFKKDLSPEHPDTITAEEYLADSLEEEGSRMEEARAVRRRVYEARYYAQGPFHTDSLLSLEKLATLLARCGEMVEAEQQARKVFQLRAEKLGANHIDTLRSARILAGHLRDLGSELQLVEAHALLQEAKKAGSFLGHYKVTENISQAFFFQLVIVDRSVARVELGKVLASLGDLDQAVHELNQVVELQSKTIGPKSVQALEAIQALASLKESAALQGNGSVKRLGDSVSVTRAAVDVLRRAKAEHAERGRQDANIELTGGLLLPEELGDAENRHTEVGARRPSQIDEYAAFGLDRTDALERMQQSRRNATLQRPNMKVTDKAWSFQEDSALSQDKVRQQTASKRNSVKLTVGGEPYWTTVKTLQRYPESLLGRLLSGQEPVVSSQMDGLCIDRDGRLFVHILNYLRDDWAKYFGLDDLHKKLGGLQEPRPRQISGNRLTPANYAAMRSNSVDSQPGFSQSAPGPESEDLVHQVRTSRQFVRLRYGHEYSGGWIISSPRNLPGVDYELHAACLARSPLEAMMPRVSELEKGWEILMYKDLPIPTTYTAEKVSPKASAKPPVNPPRSRGMRAQVGKRIRPFQRMRLPMFHFAARGLEVRAWVAVALPEPRTLRCVSLQQSQVSCCRALRVHLQVWDGQGWQFEHTWEVPSEGRLLGYDLVVPGSCTGGLDAGAGIQHDCDGAPVIGLKEGDTCKASCAPGFVGGEAEFVCQGDGTLQGAAPTCVDVQQYTQFSIYALAALTVLGLGCIYSCVCMVGKADGRLTYDVGDLPKSFQGRWLESKGMTSWDLMFAEQRARSKAEAVKMYAMPTGAAAGDQVTERRGRAPAPETMEGTGGSAAKRRRQSGQKQGVDGACSPCEDPDL
eukprot:s1819_g3.t1